MASETVRLVYQFNHPQFLESDGALQFFRAERATVLLGGENRGGFRQLCQITFNKNNGSIYVQFTYFPESHGLVGLLTSTISTDLKSALHFRDGGKHASSLVKYSHPKDGNAHFSQDGKALTTFRTKSVPLDKEGHLAELHAFGLNEFSLLLPGQERRKRLYLPFWADKDHAGATVALEWRRRDSLQRAAAPDTLLGPIGELPRRRDGKPFLGALLAAPASCDMEDFVLTVNVHPVQRSPERGDRPFLSLLGGWPYPEPAFQPDTNIQLLAFLYPIPDPDAAIEELGSVDYVQSSRGPV